MVQLIPLPLTVSCSSKIQIGFTFLVPAHPGSPGQRAVKWVCMGVCEVVPLNTDTDSSCTTECVSGHWSDDVKEENLADLRPDVVLFCQHILLLNHYCDCSWFKFSVLPVKVKLGMVG